MPSGAFEIGKLILFSNSFIAVLIVAFFMAKSVLLAISFFREIDD